MCTTGPAPSPAPAPALAAPPRPPSARPWRGARSSCTQSAPALGSRTAHARGSAAHRRRKPRQVTHQKFESQCNATCTTRARAHSIVRTFDSARVGALVPQRPTERSLRHMLITGVQRSGTHYAWEMMNRLGVHVHHEGLGPDGAVSWFFASVGHHHHHHRRQHRRHHRRHLRHEHYLALLPPLSVSIQRGTVSTHPVTTTIPDNTHRHHPFTGTSRTSATPSTTPRGSRTNGFASCCTR